MNYYETVYIIHPALQEGRLKDIVNKFHKKLEDDKGEVLYITNWGKKKLAYPIDKQKYGTYILCQYSIDGDKLKTIAQELELNPNVLRFLITKIDESKILEGSNELIAEADTSKIKQKEKESTSNTEKNKSTDKELSVNETSSSNEEKSSDESSIDNEEESLNESSSDNEKELTSDKKDNDKPTADEDDNSSDDNKE